MSKDANYRKLIGSPRWRALRNAYLSEHPQCEECLSRGLYRAANCVHHIIPCETARSVKEMELLMFSASNLRALPQSVAIARRHTRQGKQTRSNASRQSIPRRPRVTSPNPGGRFMRRGVETPKSTCPLLR